MTPAVLLFCALALAWSARVLLAAGREQVELYRASSISPDEVNADAAELNAALDVLLADTPRQRSLDSIARRHFDERYLR